MTNEKVKCIWRGGCKDTRACESAGCCQQITLATQPTSKDQVAPREIVESLIRFAQHSALCLVSQWKPVDEEDFNCPDCTCGLVLLEQHAKQLATRLGNEPPDELIRRLENISDYEADSAHDVICDAIKALRARAPQPPEALRPGLARAIQIIEAIEPPSDYYEPYKTRLVDALCDAVYSPQTKEPEHG